jgi:hypothetical protein
MPGQPYPASDDAGGRNARKLLARVIGGITVIMASQMLLRIVGVLPKRNSMLTAYSERHSILLPALNSIESILFLFAGVLLWQMSKVAFRLFLAELAIAIAATWYLVFYAPTPQTTVLHRLHGGAFFAVIGFGLLFEALRCGCAWWITSKPPTGSEHLGG